MFRSKTIGWITALTLLCVAGVALACRLKDGSGASAQARAANWSSPEGSDAPLPPPESPLPPPFEPAKAESKIPPSPPPENVAVPVPAPSAPEPDPLVKEESAPPIVPQSDLPPPPPTAPVVASEPSAPPPPVDGKAAETTTPPAKPSALPPMDVKPDVPTATIPVTPPLPSKDVTEKTKEPTSVIQAPYREEPRPMTLADPKVYWASKGETLKDVARKTLGSEDRWKELDRLNEGLRGSSLIPTGTMIRLPGDASAPPAGGQAESEATTPMNSTGLKPLPIVRMRRPVASRLRSPMTGSFECKVDERRGVVIPKEAVEQFGKSESFLMTPGPDGCLWIVTQAGAPQVVERIEKSQVDNSDVEGFRRLFYSQSAKCAMDSTGRVEIPAKLADFAGLSADVVLVGVEDHFELWDAARWHRYSQQKGSMTKSFQDRE